MFIVLTGRNDQEIWLQTDKIAGVTTDDDGDTQILIDGREVYVEESVAEVLLTYRHSRAES